MNRIYNLEIKNANLQLEIGLLKQNVKWLMETVNNYEEFIKKINQFTLLELFTKLELTTNNKSYDMSTPNEGSEGK